MTSLSPGSEHRRETPTVVRVRPAQPADAMEVAGVHVRSWQRAYRGLLPDKYLDALRPEVRAARYTFGQSQSEGPTTLVALEGPAICGFATIGAANDQRDGSLGELLALYVDPDHWGQGIGRRLMVAARRLLTERAFDRAILWVLEGNERAERFYRADRWVPDGTHRQIEVWDVMADEVRYRRNLP